MGVHTYRKTAAKSRVAFFICDAESNGCGFVHLQRGCCIASVPSQYNSAPWLNCLCLRPNIAPMQACTHPWSAMSHHDTQLFLTYLYLRPDMAPTQTLHSPLECHVTP
eukprot:1142234-Pelagomonas_calceolata.AAC.6